MRWIYGLAIVLIFACFKCDGPAGDDCANLACAKATVKELNLDGCEFVLELTDGTRLVPERRVYVQPPKKEEDPAYYFDFVDGAEVCITYKNSDVVNACMAGQSVFLTRIEEFSN